MQITAVFTSYEEMKGFAETLLGSQPVISMEPAAVSMEPADPSMEPAAVSMELQKEETPAEEKESYTMVDVRGKLGELNKAGKKAEVKALLESFGAEKLSQVDPENYAELMKKAGEL